MAGKALPREHYVAKFWGMVDKTDTCWLWTGMTTPTGYASFYAGIHGGGKTYAHRFVYDLMVGRIPDGYDIDHLCRVRNCVNPDHLEAVTHRENMLRGDTVVARMAAKTHCAKGHPLDGIYEGSRYCTTCKPRRGRGQQLRSECKQGHPFDEANTYWHNGYRHCKTCRAAANRRRTSAA